MSVRDLTILGCSSQQPTRRRNQSGYLFRWHEQGLLFDPGEGTQRQFIYAGIAPPTVTSIFISHFHGDHCLGLGSMLMRLNLDKVTHPIHCYYPASGKVYFDRLRYGTIYHEIVNVVEHPVKQAGVVYQDEEFTIEATFLQHGIDNIGWRVTEKDFRRFDAQKLKNFGIRGPDVKLIEKAGFLDIHQKRVFLDDVSTLYKGDSIAVVIDTLPCKQAYSIAKDARLLLCESTYLEAEASLAKKHRHMTAQQAARIAKESDVDMLVLTHFSARYQNLEGFEQEAREIFQNTHVADDFKQFPFPRLIDFLRN